MGSLPPKTQSRIFFTSLLFCHIFFFLDYTELSWCCIRDTHFQYGKWRNFPRAVDLQVFLSHKETFQTFHTWSRYGRDSIVILVTVNKHWAVSATVTWMLQLLYVIFSYLFGTLLALRTCEAINCSNFEFSSPSAKTELFTFLMHFSLGFRKSTLGYPRRPYRILATQIGS